MRSLLYLSGALVLLMGVAVSQAPSLAAGGLLHPARRSPRTPAPPNCAEREFAGRGVRLRGWQCHAISARRGTIVSLHGVADNRDSSIGVIRRFITQGFDVVAYDSRAHGASEGDLCTYGYFEKDDLRRVIDTLPPGPVVLMGTSLGGAVALQEAATDERISAVIAAEVFSDLETIARDRAPFFLVGPLLARAFRHAERRGGFSVGAVSPVDAARRIHVPVLLIHGEADIQTPPEHSRRVFDALAGPKRLILVPGAGHNHSLRDPGLWTLIETWIGDVLEQAGTPDTPSEVKSK